MIRCIIIDDKPLAVEILTDYVSKVPFLELVFCTNNPLEALPLIMDGKTDLLFLDIQMPQLTGLQLMKIIQDKCKVVLTTAYAEYALDGYENDAVDYLLKPISFDRFYRAVHKVQALLRTSDAVVKEKTEDLQPRKQQQESSIQNVNDEKALTYIFVKTEYKLLRIDLSDILYIEGMQNYVIIHTLNERIVSLQNIKKTEEQLQGTQFIRVHKSYIIALNQIKSIERNRININGVLIPVGDVYRKAFYEIVG